MWTVRYSTIVATCRAAVSIPRPRAIGIRVMVHEAMPRCDLEPRDSPRLDPSKNMADSVHRCSLATRATTGNINATWKRTWRQ